MSTPHMPFELPHEFVNHIQLDPTDQRKEFWFIFKDSKLLVDEDTYQPSQIKNLAWAHTIYMGTFKDFHLYVGEPILNALPAKTVWIDLKQLYEKINDDLIALAGRGMQLLFWQRTHQFCGQCGNKTSQRPHERAKECSSCKLLTFPNISPAIMVLIQKGKEILLARGTNFSAPFYSALAGFVDPGETLEYAIHREVFEEVGLYVDHLQYFRSQPWPFSNSLMIAFTCQWKSGEIRINTDEIIDAQWFHKDRLPLLPATHSISRILIDHVVSKIEL